MQYDTNANYRISRPQLFFKIGVLKKMFLNIHKRTSMLESLFKKGLQLYQRDSNTGLFL